MLIQSLSLSLLFAVVESDSPWAYPNTRASKLSPDVKTRLTDRSLAFVNRSANHLCLVCQLCFYAMSIPLQVLHLPAQ